MNVYHAYVDDPHPPSYPKSPSSSDDPFAESQVTDSQDGGVTTPGTGVGSVLLSTGGFTFRRLLLALDAIGGIAFGFRISHLSGAGVDSIAGLGINCAQNMRLAEANGGDLLFVMGDSVREHFEHDGGAYVAGPDNNTRAILRREGAGADETFVMTSRMGVVTRFFGFDEAIDTPGRPKSIRDRYGNELTYTWSVVGGRAALDQVTDAYGRSVQLTYHDAGADYRLKQIEDVAGRRVNFQYDGEGRLLAAVMPSISKAAGSNSFPGGTAYVFEYDTGNSRPERRDDIIRLWHPNEVAPYVDGQTRTVDVAAVYAHAQPRYAISYGQDPTDEEHWGRVVAETIGAPGQGVGGTYEYVYTTADLPDNIIDANDPIVFRCVVTDRNDNQIIYDFNAASVPVRIERIATRNKNSLQGTSWVTWTKYDEHNQPVLRVMPEGNSVEYAYEDGQVAGIAGVFNRRVGLLLRETHRPGNPIGLPSRTGSNGQEELTRRYFYEPLFGQRCAVIEERGNPVDGSGGYFTPQNGGVTPTDSDRSRYATITYLDYQQNQAATVTGDTALQELLQLSASEIQALIDHVDAQMKAAGLPAGFEMDLGDLNGDGTGNGASSGLPAARVLGDRVKIKHPAVRLIGSQQISTQQRVEVFTTNARGQTTTHTDPEGNVTAYVRYAFSDPDGGGQHTVPGNGNKQYGRVKQVHVDVDPDDVMDLIGSDGDLAGFTLMIGRTNTPGVYQSLVTRYEGSGAGPCASCGYDLMGNPLAVTDPRGFTTRYDRNERGVIYRETAPDPYACRTETYYDANGNVTRVDVEDIVVDYDSNDPASPAYAHFTPTGSGSTAQLPTKAGTGGALRAGWFTDLRVYDLLDNLIEEDRDATGSTPDRLVSAFDYDANNNLIKVTRPAGNTVEYDYDERDLRIAQRVGYDPQNGEDGAITVWVYDGNGNLAQTIGPQNYVGQDGVRGIVTIADAFHSSQPLTHTGMATESVYDGFDRAVAVTDARENVAEYAHDPGGRIVETVHKGTADGDYASPRVELARCTVRFDEAGRAYEHQRDVFLAAGVSVPSGRTVTHTGGGLAANSTADDHTAVATLTSGEESYVLSRTVHDRAGRVVETLTDNAAVTAMDYDGADRLIKRSDPLGNTVAHVHDANGNVIETTRTEACTITQPTVDDEVFRSAARYDCLNRRIVTVEQGADGGFDPDVAIAWPPVASAPSSTFALAGYDSRGNRTNTIDRKGNTVAVAYDGAGRGTQRVEHLRVNGQGSEGPLPNKTFAPSGGSCVVTQTAYDANGRISQIIDDRGGTTSFSYDTLDREVLITAHDGRTRSFVYNAASDLTQLTDENGSVLDYTYDALGRRIETGVTPASGIVGTTGQTFSYDGLGRPLLSRDSVGSADADVTQVHDALSRTIERSATHDGATHHVTHTAFTSLQASGVTYPDGRTLDVTDDALYRVSAVGDSGGSIGSWQYFGPGRLAELALGNGLIRTRMNNARTHAAVQPGVANPGWGSADSDRLGYDGAGRVIATRYLAGGIDSGTHAYQDTTPVVGFTRWLDRSSNAMFRRALQAESRSSLYEPIDSGVPQGGYDSLDRLRQYQRGVLASGGESVATPIALPGTDQQRDYDLDGLSNWKHTDYTPVGAAAEVNETRNHNKLNLITRRQPDQGDPWIDFVHDDNGNLLDDGVRTYAWDAFNRLVEVRRKADDTLIGAYVYSALDDRIRRTVSNGGLTGGIANGVTVFIHGGDGRCIEERDDADALLRQYVWAGAALVQMRSHGGGSTADFYLLADQANTAAALTDDAGAIVEAYDSDARGNTLIFDAPGTGGDWWADDAGQVDAPTCAFIFTGRRYDAESGLYDSHARYYAPAWGRFINPALPLPRI